MTRGIDLLANVGNAADDAGGCLVVHDADSLDRVGAVIGELVEHDGRVRAMAPVAGDEIDVQPDAGRHVLPQRRKVAGLEHQHCIAR